MFLIGKSDGDIFIRIFLTKGFKKNDYSELIFYNENEEIFASIFPKYGRVVVWNDTADFTFRPPSFNVEQGEYSLLIKVTEDESKFIKHEEKFQVHVKTYLNLLYLFPLLFPLVYQHIFA